MFLSDMKKGRLIEAPPLFHLKNIYFGTWL